jgi:hypothetical protein
MVNGIEYIPKPAEGDIKIVVLERGFVYVGEVTELDDGIRVENARNIIRWGTSRHIAELVNGPLEDTRLGDVCSFKAYTHSVIHMLDVESEKWKI